ncbi:hypothetical protein EJ03DRAFT_313194 [Teratosphaeria nubilosa]|uniref:Uncharacterized protein n=1 Tax=Teratosphaeria nubilosa TaxID=161662 RepID=A0A6G1L7Q1_9PEZI|nr:hypothetical protein EJ03DRAFT_313194 [Teratosphaeria nubilosa]
MPPDLPPRRFAPEPVETTSRSSKAARQQSPEIKKSAPRRFAPEPIETSSKSSKDRNGGEGNAKENGPTAPTAKPRRFAPQPIETSTKSSRDSEASQSEQKPVRKFAPQPIETSQKSSKNRGSTSRSGHIKFAPQPVGTTYRTNRKVKDSNDGDARLKGETARREPRRFAPVLLATAKRSRRNGEADSPQLYKTESGHHLHAREHRRHIRGDATPNPETQGQDGPDLTSISNHLSVTQPQEIQPDMRRQLAPMDGSAPPNRKNSISSQRSHSFRMPELDTIESSESEPASSRSSLSSSPAQGSPITASDSSYNGTYRHATRKRESVDESFSNYLLQLEAKKAEQRLRDQALAAFPNSDFHEPVDHWVDKEDDSDDMELEDRPVTWADFDEDILLQMAARRESTVKISWEQLEMQRHAEKLEQERNAAKTTAKQPSQGPWWHPDNAFGIGNYDNEMKSMRDRARPPMLGADLVFPRCPSPEPARFDVTQGSAILRNQMCYLTEHAESEKRRTGEDGLWQAPKSPKTPVNKSRANSRTAASPNKGLWGGFCVDDGENQMKTPGLLAPPTGQTGIMTPNVETTVNPFEQSFAKPGLTPEGNGLQTPPTPMRASRSSDMGAIDGMLNAEQELDEVMEREFPDSFVTQVYNYLSLGYPSLARPFDEELSKISRIPVSELRKDDIKAKNSPRGYIRLGPDFEGHGEEPVEQDCVRWQALKLYVREWARQEKNMVSFDSPGGNWGTGARRGSWAI